MNWKRFNWLSDGVVPLLVALLRVLWLAPWLELLRQWVAPAAHSPVLPIGVMLALILCSVAAARTAADPGGNLTAGRLAIVYAGFAAILFVLWWQFYRGPFSLLDTRWLSAMAAEMTRWQGSLPASFLAAPVLIYLWLQGILDGRQALDRDQVWGAFVAGFLALVLCALGSFAAGRVVPSGMGVIVLFYFATGMAALALASLETTRTLAAHEGNGQIAVNRYWLLSVASVIVVLLLVGLLLSALFTPDVIAHLFAWTARLMDVLGIVLYYVLLVFAYLIFALLQPLIDLLQSAMVGQKQDQPMEIRSDFASQLQELQRGTATLPPQWAALLRWLGLAALIVLIGLAFALALRRFQRRRSDSADETRESILTRDLLGRQLGDLLRNLLRRTRGAAADDRSPFLSLDGEPDTRRQIRQLYQTFLAAMEGQGHPRQRSQTPREYEVTLGSILPDAQADLSALTDGYMQARYAALPPERSLAAAVRSAWERLQALLAPPPH